MDQIFKIVSSMHPWLTRALTRYRHKDNVKKSLQHLRFGVDVLIRKQIQLFTKNVLYNSLRLHFFI